MAKQKTYEVDLTTRNEAEYIICKYNYKLDEQQQDFIRKNYDHKDYKGDIVKLAQIVHQDPSIDEESDEVTFIRNFILRHRKQYISKTVRPAYNFTLEEIDYILTNGETITPIELTKKLLPANVDKGQIVIASQTISNLLEANGLQGANAPKVIFDPQKYTPPPTIAKLIARINDADINAKFHINDLQKDSRKKACVNSLFRNMHSPLFIATASAWNTKLLRDLFETEFIRMTYDKSDLTAEESNSYISLCNEYAHSIRLGNRLAELDDKLAGAMTAVNPNKEWAKNISDSRNAMAKEYHDCKLRIKQLQESLHGKRIDRLEKEGQANESLAKWIDLVMVEEGREKLLRLTEARNLELENEIKRISSLNELVAQFAGVSAEEILKCKF